MDPLERLRKINIMKMEYNKQKRYILALACLTRYDVDHRHNPYPFYTLSHHNHEARLYRVRTKIRYISLVLKEAVGEL